MSIATFAPLPTFFSPATLLESKSPFAPNIATKLVQRGAVMRLPQAAPALVGDLVWENGGVLLWFTAFGDAPSDAHRLEFDETQPLDRFGLCFLHRGNVCAYLSSIDAAGLDDPDDYHVAWKFWNEVAPLKQDFIQRCYEELRTS